jgi:surface carbohydrate biosynthesis protein
MSTTIILPVETAARELDAKLLLAAHMTARGWKVILGSHARINNNLHRLPVRSGDVYLSQTIIRAKRRLFRILEDMGLIIAAWDEEGFVWRSPAFYRERRLDDENFRRLARFYAWGETQARVVCEAFPDLARERLRVTGNPRQDLLAPPLRPLYAEAASRLRDELGGFILVNSNFGSLNHARAAGAGPKKTEEDLRRLAARSIHDLGYMRFRYRVFRSFCRLLPELSRAFPERTIVVRPHPSENPEVWNAVVRDLPNVIVRYEHDLIPWLMAADAIIHNGCTTAIEAALLGQIAIEYRAVSDPEWENPQPRAVSVPAASAEEVISLIRRGIPAPDQKAVTDALSEIFAGWNEGLASVRIADDLTELTARFRDMPPAWRRARGRLFSALRGVEKWLTGRLMPSKSASPAYVDKKFPPMDTSVIQARIARLAELGGAPRPQVRNIGDRTWLIFPDETETMKHLPESTGAEP